MSEYEYQIGTYKNLHEFLVASRTENFKAEVVQILPNPSTGELTILFKKEIKQKITTKDKEINNLKALLQKAYDIIENNEIQSAVPGSNILDVLGWRAEVSKILKSKR